MLGGGIAVKLRQTHPKQVGESFLTTPGCVRKACPEAVDFCALASRISGWERGTKTETGTAMLPDLFTKPKLQIE